MEIIFVRHPETMANVNRLLYGRSDSPYSEKGIASIPRVADDLASREIDDVYSSPLRRAFDLAKAITDEHQSKEFEIIEDDRLMEMNFGLFENKTSEEAREIYGPDYDRLWENFAEFKMPKGESMVEVKERVVEFLEEILGQEKTVVVVAHALVIRSALSYLLDMPLNEIWHFDIKPASIVEVSYIGDYGILTRLQP